MNKIGNSMNEKQTTLHADPSPIRDLTNALTPKQIVAELDRYIIGQNEAKRSVAIALRNRSRRQMLPEDMRDEVAPKNIIMVGSTGVGKTEIARRLAKLVDAPFIKVEASKYTEVGYVGRDVESMIRDLTDLAINMVKSEHTVRMKSKADRMAEERILDILFPPPRSQSPSDSEDTSQGQSKIEEEGEAVLEIYISDTSDDGVEATSSTNTNLEVNQRVSEADKAKKAQERYQKTRDKFRQMLQDGKFEDKEVEVEVKTRGNTPLIEIFSSSGIEEMDINFKDMFGSMMPKNSRKRQVSVSEAREILAQEEAEKLIDVDAVVVEAVDRVENSGIVFLDEIDKVAGRESTAGPDVSREGVQRDILPIVEGSNVMTKHGMVRTDHILFVAAGAFHTSKPSDLIPELQGRFPIRVSLKSLDQKDFKKILTEPKNALTKQYIAMMKTEDLNVDITESAIDTISGLAFQVNESVEDIGARRLHTIMEKLFEQISFDAPDIEDKQICIDAEYVDEQLAEIAQNQDLSRYIL